MYAQIKENYLEYALFNFLFNLIFGVVKFLIIFIDISILSFSGTQSHGKSLHLKMHFEELNYFFHLFNPNYRNTEMTLWVPLNALPL